MRHVTRFFAAPAARLLEASGMRVTAHAPIAPARAGVCLLLLMAALMFACHAEVASASVSVNFVSRSAPGVSPDFLRVESGASSSGVAGVNGNDVWNDVELSIGSEIVTGNSGEVATIDWATFGSTVMWSQTGSGNRTVALENPSGDMMDGHFEGWTPTDITVTMSGLADDFSTYDVYLYIGDDAGGRTGSFSINGGTAVSFTSQLFTGTFNQVTTPGQAGNYILFAGVTGDSFTIVGGGDNVSNRTGIRGIEVVQAAVPEPTTFVVWAGLGLASLGFVSVRKKFRKS